MEKLIVRLGEGNSDHEKKQCVEKNRMGRVDLYIFYPDDLSYSGGFNAIKSRGLKVPDDISMVGYDGIKLSQILNPKLTTVEQQSRKIGMLAARELIACIENPKTALVKRVVVDGRLLEGETVKDIRQK